MKDSRSSLLSCWPDGYSRYYSVSNILRIVFGTKETIDILDVGGDSKWMAAFLDNSKLSYALNIVDTRKPDFENTHPNITYTRKDFFKLKKSDHHADAVINTDVLEHIPDDMKIPFVNQCIEFSESIVIFSAPQEDGEVTSAEMRINGYYKFGGGKQQRWLKEHFEYGKPDSTKIESEIKKHGYPYIKIDTNRLENWFMSFSLNFINSEVSGLKGMDRFNRYYNENIHKIGDFSGKPYRRIFVVFKDENLYRSAREELQSFFKPDTSKYLDLWMHFSDLLVDNFRIIQNKDRAITKHLKSLENDRDLLKVNLRQTQSAFVTAKTELDAIKASRAYRVALTMRRLLRRK